MVSIPLTSYIYIYQLMSNVQLPWSKTFDTQILIHSIIQNNDVSLAKEIQKHLSKEHQKNGFIDKGKYIKRASERKYTDREYRVKDNSDVAHKKVKNYCNTNQFQ